MTESYNGYKNRETWAMALWFHNDEYLNNEFLPETLAYHKGNKYSAGQALKDWFEDGDWEEARRDVGSIWRVEWHEMF